MSDTVEIGSSPAARASQLVAETLSVSPNQVRASQLSVEILSSREFQLRSSQLIVEVLYTLAITVVSGRTRCQRGHSVVILPENLSASWLGVDPSELIFTVTPGHSVTAGTLLLNGAQTRRFTMADIAADRLSYLNAFGSTTFLDQFDFSVSVGGRSLAPVPGTFYIDIYDVAEPPPPVPPVPPTILTKPPVVRKERWYEIPLKPMATSLGVVLAGKSYRITVNWRDDDQGGWFLDLADGANNPLVSGIPLVTGLDLMFQHGYLNLGGGLFIVSEGDAFAVPTYDSLGVSSRLYYIQAAN